MKRLGNPQEDLKYVHIAGTNGKGSVIAFLYSALSQAGYRVGRYVSPTLYSYRGRIAVAGQMIDRDSFALYLTQVTDAIQTTTDVTDAKRSTIKSLMPDTLTAIRTAYGTDAGGAQR